MKLDTPEGIRPTTSAALKKEREQALWKIIDRMTRESRNSNSNSSRCNGRHPRLSLSLSGSSKHGRRHRNPSHNILNIQGRYQGW